MNKVDIKRGARFVICEGKYPDRYGEILAVSKEMGMVLYHYWFGSHFGDQQWMYVEDVEKLHIKSDDICECCGNKKD